MERTKTDPAHADHRQRKELKAIFRAHDYTTYVPKYDASKATVEENRIHSRAKEIFYKAAYNKKTQISI